MIEKKLRVTIMGLNYSPEPTGIAPYTSRLAEALVRDGHHINVITGYPHYPEWRLREGYSGWRSEEVINGVRVKRLRHYIPEVVNNLRRMHMELSFGVRLLFARWNDPDVILIVSPALFSAAFVLLRARCGIRRPATGLWIQDLYSRGVEETKAGGAWTSRLMNRIEGFVLRSATGVAVIHDRFEKYLVQNLAVDEGRIAVIRNWTHVGTETTCERQPTRAKLGWEDDDVIVLHAGNMGAKQGLENVVKAAHLAHQRKSKVRFAMLGDGNQRSHIQALARGIGHIEFIAPLSDQEFTQVLGSADILLVNEKAGLRETAVPSKLTSYFSSGLPVIAATEADSTTAGEINLSRGGIRVDPNSPGALLEAAEYLATDRNMSAALGQAGLGYARSVLSQDAAILQYSAWLHKLAIAAQDLTRLHTSR